MKNKIIFLSIVYSLLSIVCSCVIAQELRQPAWAGQFYPADKTELQKMISDFLNNVPEKKIDGKILGIIVPHAGYVYSGQVAAYSFKLLEGRKIDTVILIGASHHEAFENVAAYTGDYWQTPLGKVEIDKEITNLIIKESNNFVESGNLLHSKEHSLEVEVPFLQVTARNFKIVPLLIGRLSPEGYAYLIKVLTKVFEETKKSVIMVFSSDMSHYHNYGKACLMDGLCLDNIKALDSRKFQNDINSGLTEMCGAGPVLIMMELAAKLGAKAEILKYANSGDVEVGDKNRVVGYGSVVFYTEQKNVNKNSSENKKNDLMQGVAMLNEKQQKRLIEIARKTLEEYIRNGKVPEFKETDPVLTEKRGGFVTLTKNGQLRGCIGYIEGVLPLYLTVQEMAIKASTEDYRFSPVKPDELKDISIEISALTPLELIKDINIIEVGKHGLIIRKGGYSGLLLPQVATAYNWDKYEFLDQTCVKAGLAPGTWRDKDAQIYIFSAQVFHEEK